MRRREYVSGILGASFLSGCIGSDSGTSPSNTDENRCEELVDPSNTLDSFEPSNGRFELSVSERTVTFGNDLQICLKNTTNSNENTGVKNRYLFQSRQDSEWVTMTKYETNDWSLLEVGHDPGEGFSWTFEVTRKGLSTDHQYCGDLDIGTHRFVYWATEPSVAIEFNIVEE